MDVLIDGFINSHFVSRGFRGDSMIGEDFPTDFNWIIWQCATCGQFERNKGGWESMSDDERAKMIAFIDNHRKEAFH